MDETTVTINIAGSVNTDDPKMIIDEIIQILQKRDPQLISYNSKDESRVSFGTKSEGFRERGPVKTEINITV